ncbi:MAG: histidine phosphatase family protein [Dehalococcoidia bacterium]|nr:histidine phosphatase family protein [Dehalococcoidia bacterium]
MVTEPVRLYLVRHGQARAGDGSYGHDTPLSPLGRRQAGAVGVALAHASLAAIYASPMRRARETARPLARLTGLEVRVDDRLSEFELADWGPDQEFDWTIWRGEDAGVPGGETLQAFAERVGAACDDIVTPHAGEAVAIISHSGTNDAILRWAMSIPAEAAWFHEFDLPNGAVVELLVWPEGRHPEGAPRYGVIQRAPNLDHLPEPLRSDS